MIKFILFTGLLISTIFILAIWNMALHVEIEAKNKALENLKYEVLPGLCQPATVLKKPTYEFAPISTTTTNK